MPAAQIRPPCRTWTVRAAKVRPGAELDQLEPERLTRIGYPHHDHAGRHDPSARRVTAGGDDGLPEHLAPLDDGPALVAPGHTEEPESFLSGTDVHHVNQMRGIAPGREPLHRDVARHVPLGLVRDLNPYPVLIERGVAGQLAGRLRRADMIGQPRGSVEIHVLEWEVEDRQLTGSLGAETRVGLGHDPAIPPGARSVRVTLDFHAETRRSAHPAGRGATVTDEIATEPWWRTVSTTLMRSSIPTNEPLM